LKDYNEIIPAIVEIPSSEHKYDTSKDYILQKAKFYLPTQQNQPNQPNQEVKK
jgi:vacuolar-type H+-ATPase subunit F/Vma7